MSESSDDSFAWAYGSNASSDSSGLTTAEEMNNSQQSETESEKGFKKKLHKKIFQKTEAEVKCELLDEKVVKCEQESDAERDRRKRKWKRERSSSRDSATADAAPDDYLAQRVKQEWHDHPAKTNNSKVKSAIKHKQDSQCNGDDSYENIKSNESTDTASHKTKKKKSKRKKEHLESDCNHTDVSIDDKFTAEETVVQYQSHKVDQDVVIENKSVIKKAKKSKKSNERRKDSITCNNSTNGDITNNLTRKESLEVLNDELEPQKPEKSYSDKKTKEHIQFEDEIDTNYVQNNATIAGSQYSSQLKRYLKANPHLQTITNKNDCELLITQDDDIWLFNCPHEINITSLKDENVSLDNKCKIKVDDQTYVGNMEIDSGRMTILMFDGKRPVIKNIALSGTINFHKRIPKAHFIQDNVMLNNQAYFIPLPNTKCRHPLFGPDYKKAIKIPSSVKTRLKDPFVETMTPLTEKKKKKKKHIIENIEVEMEDDQSAKVSKKRRKRKLSGTDDDHAEHPKPKRVKSEEAWDSEKAIEEKLFNF
uniref:Uncharacterized protein n=1 Tax=Pectinophora gossypiella TaxID=13191 RepID=A0A1E1W5M0_PECGO